MRIWVTISLRSSFLSGRPGRGVAVAGSSFPLKLVSVAKVVLRRVPPVSVRSTTVLLLPDFPLVVLLIGFHFLDPDVAVVMASSDSVVRDVFLKSSFLALAITSSRLPPLELETESLGSDFVLLSASAVCCPGNPFGPDLLLCSPSPIFIGDVPSGLGALSERCGVPTTLVSTFFSVVSSLSAVDFLFDFALSAEASGPRPPDVEGGGMVPLGRSPVRRDLVGVR